MAQKRGRRRPQIEDIEPRILMSADDPLSATLQSGNDVVLAAPALPATAPASANRELVFVDGRLDDVDSLIATLQQAAGDATTLEIIRVASTDDAIAAIGERLAAGEAPVTAIHLLGHGEAGRMELGRTGIDRDTLMIRAGEIAGWRDGLADQADILLYGCDLAAGPDGTSLVDDLALLTGADVAASTDLTGAAALGGNWALETRTGTIESVLARQLEAQAATPAAWQGVMATITVTSSAQTGAGTLNAAIAQANASGVANTIVFAANVTTINLTTTALPTITSQLTIDGTVSGKPGVLIDGRDNAFAGLVLGTGSSGSTVRGLVVTNFGGNGIEVRSNNNVVAGNYVGALTATGGAAALTLANTGWGIAVDGTNNTIGGTGANDRNVIAGNGKTQIVVTSTATGTRIVGNHVGTDVTGTVDVSGSGAATVPDHTGIIVQGASGVVIGGTTSAERNVISGNNYYGIELVNGTANARVQGNYIGTNAAGTAALANGYGLSIYQGGAGNLIGGGAAGAGNVISGNADHGIYIGYSANGGLIQGNRIGLSANGTADLSNGNHGISIDQSTGFVVGTNGDGTNDAGEGNLIVARPGKGVAIYSSSSNNVVAGNQIGASSNGSTVFGGVRGINLTDNSPNNRIGGTLPVQGNKLYGLTVGIVLEADAGNGTPILGNTMTGSGRSIDLNNDGTTANDTGDGDTGANERQNTPVIAFASNGSSAGRVTGSLNTTANTAIRIEFYGASAAGPSGSGLAQVYLGSTNVTTDGSGNARFDAQVGPIVLGQYISATATRSDAGYTSFTSTSEVSAAIQATNVVVVTTTTDNNDSAIVAGNAAHTLEWLNANRGGDNKVSLREAIIAANNTDGAIPVSIAFDLGGSGVQTIQLSSKLDDIKRQVSIDGSSGGVPNVMLDGNGGEYTALTLANGSANSVIRGLVIRDFGTSTSSPAAVVVASGATGVKIVGNYIGQYNGDGSKAANSERNEGRGIEISATGVIVGGTTAADRNVIGGNGADQIRVTNTGHNAIIIGNYIGTDRNGSVTIYTGVDSNYGTSGVSVSGASGVRIGGTAAGERNLISGNGSYGVELTDGASSATVQANLIGTNLSGTAAIGNGRGIVLWYASNVLIGGSATGAGNVIAGNGGWGILIQGGSGATVQGNLIGLGSNGSTELLNGWESINIYDSTGVLVGTNGDGNNDVNERNLIVTNNGRVGVSIGGSNAYNNVVAGNWFGLASDGTTQRNVSSPIRIDNGAYNNRIGGVGAGEGNLISGPSSIAIQVGTGSAAGSGNAILGNLVRNPQASSMYIDIDGNGLTANDALDADTGSNDRQNFPVVTAATADASTGKIRGTLSARPSSYYRIEVFGGTATNSSGTGVPQYYVGTVNVATDASGRARFEVASGSAVLVGHRITATATETTNSSYNVFRSTSELGSVTVAIAPAPPVGTNRNATATEDITYVFTMADFGFADGNNDLYPDGYTDPNEDPPAAVRIETLPVSGQLLLNGVAVTTSQRIVVADIVAGRLTYVPVANANDSTVTVADRRFGFTVQDNTNTYASASNTMQLAITAVNDAPVITSNGGGATAAISIAENTTAVTTVTSTDVENTAGIYSISGGADAAKFQIDASTGVLRFITAPDFDVPGDVGGNNVYDVIVRASDGSLFDEQAIAVTVTDISNVLVVTTIADTNDSGITAGNSAHTIEWLNVNRGTDTAISLREAIIAANNTATATTATASITFNITGTGVHTISLGSALPAITRPVTLDASTENSVASGGTRLAIVLDGNNRNADGLTLANGSAGSTIRGLVIRNFNWSGILVQSGATGVTIAGNYIGNFNADGSAVATTLANDRFGIQVEAATVRIGGTTTADRNLISGNGSDQIRINAGAANARITGNHIGTDLTGTVDVSGANPATSSSSGIAVNGADGAVIGGTTTAERNLISGNNHYGIALLDNTTNASVQGNWIGTDITGSLDLGNGHGMCLWNIGPGNVIGGSAAGAANVIAGNDQQGIYLGGTTPDSGNPSPLVRIQGNLIGVNAAGTASLGNGLNAILVQTSADILIGTDGDGLNDAAEGNVLAAAGVVAVDIYDSTGVVVAGNLIGSDKTGTTALGTAQGVLLRNSARDNRIGGTTPVLANRFVGVTTGIVVASNGGSGNAFLGNLMTGTGRSIDLNNDGTTANDTNDADTGPNDLQNTPILSTVTPHASAGRIVGVLASEANRTYRIEFYGASAAGPGGSGLAQVLLGFTQVTTNASGQATFDVTVGAIANGQWVSATATRANVSYTQYYSTSETSPAVQALSAPTGTDATITTSEDTSRALAVADFGYANPSGYALAGVRIDTLPVSGALQLSGVAVTAGQLIDVADITAGRLVYAPAANANDGTVIAASRQIRFSVRDSAGSYDAAPNTLTVSITAVNDAPQVTTNAGTTAYAENAAATVVDGALTVADIDSTNLTGATVSITGNLATAEDVLAFTSQAGITGTWNAGTGTLSFTGSATVATYQALLRSVTYRNTSDTPSTLTRTISFTVTDGALTSAAATRAVSVTAVNDAPTVTTSGGSVGYTENAAAVVIDAGLTVADPDTTTLTGAVVRISANHASAEDVLSFTAQAGITGSWDGTTGTLTFTGSASLATYQALLRTVSYQNTSDNPSTLTRTVSFTAHDGTTNSSAATRNVTITAVNDAPVITSNGGGASAAISIAENTTAVTTVVATDIDGPSLSYSISAGADAARFEIDATTGLLRFRNPPDFEAPGDADGNNVYEVVVRASDGSLNAEQAIAVTVGNVNEAPVTIDASASGNEDATSIRVDLTGTDVDDAIVRFRLTGTPAQGLLYRDAALTQQLTAGDTVDASGNVASVWFVPAANWNGVTSFQFAARDAGGLEDASPATATITVAAVNDAPQVTTTPGTAGYTENAPAVAIDPTLVVTDIDSPTLTGATVRITGNHASAEDRLSFTAQAGITGTWDAATGTLSFSGNASVADYQALLRSVSYRNTSYAPSTLDRTVSFTVSDAALTSATATRVVTVTAVNDAPLANPASAMGLEDAASIGITLTGIDGDGTVTSFRIDSLPTNGTLYLNATLSASAVATIGSLASATGNQVDLYFVPNADWNGTTSFSFSAIDDGGAVSAAAATATITVTPVNDPPIASNTSASGAEDAASIAITLAGSDIDGTVASFRIDSLPANGTLYLDVSLSTPASATPGSLVAATGNQVTVYFVPAADWNGTTSFDFTAIDDAGLASATPATATITVTPVNDAPIANDASATGAEDAASIAITLAGTDVDGTVASFRIDSLPANGTLYLDATLSAPALAAPGSLVTATGNQVTVYFVPAADWNGTTTFDFTAIDNDGLASANAATATITVTAVNDAPVVTIDPTPIGYSENAPAVAIDPTLTVTDIDSPTLTDATVRITGNHAPAEDVLSFTAQAGITGTWDAATGTLSFSGNATVADYQALLRSVSYRNTSDDPSALDRTVSVTVDDGAASSAVATRVVTITAVNDSPVANPASATGNEDAASIAVTLTGSDVDGSVASFRIDSLPTNGTLYLDATLTTPAVASPGSLVAATGNQVAVYFVPNADWNGTASFDFSAIDDSGAASAAAATATITVTAVNDAPIASDVSATGAEDAASIAITLAGTDIDGTVASFRIDSLPANGTLYLDATLTTPAVASPGSLVAATGNQVTVYFVPAADWNGATTFGFSAIDNDGLASAAPATATITVTAVNDAPVLTPASPTLSAITEDDTGNSGQTIASIVGTSISDVDPGSAQGIAITATADGSGHWQYSLDGGANWTDIGTVSDAAALLLRATDSVRFVPNGQNATSATIGYRAWDQTTGTVGDRVDATVRGGTTAFSIATDTAAIAVTAVNDAPVLAPASPVLSPITEDDTGNAGQTVASIIGGSISDVDQAAAQGIAVTATTDGNGRWEYSVDGGATWLDVGAVSDATALLLGTSDRIRFVPDGQNATSATISYRAWDQTGTGLAGDRANTATHGGSTAFSTGTNTASISVTAVNDAPVLTPASPSLPTITEDDTGNAGQTVASIVGSSISDVDQGALEGIAVTATTDGNGRWQYSIDGGATWLDVGVVSDAAALLLRATDSLRFVPDGLNATAASISYRAWDQTAGTTGNRADTSVRGGTTAFSTGTDIALLTVAAVNDAPVLAPASPTLPSITEDAVGNAGQTVASIVGASISDVDQAAVQGIAVTATANGNGRWQYSLDNGANWLDVGAVSDAAALLLRATDSLRFVPDGQNATTASIGYRAWDQSAGTVGTRVDSSVRGGTTPFSTGSDTATIAVTAVNDAPVLAPALPVLSPVTEDDTTNAGQTVASIVGATISDVDSGAVQGIAVTGTADGNGRWQYSLDGGANWLDVGAVSDATALLLRATDSLRFVPDGLNATAASISFRAWDQSAGTTGNRVDTTANGSTTAFSTGTDTASIAVTAVNDAPVLAPASPVLPAITEDDTGNAGQTVSSIVATSISDADLGAAQGIAITATTDGNGRWQYSLDGGMSWLDVGTVSDAAALLLRANDSLRFVPDGQNATTASISYRAWDQSTGTVGNRVDSSVRGGTTPFSTGTDTATIAVTAVNDAPVLTPVTPTLPAITEDDTGNAGQTVASIVGATISDVDSGAVQGIAVTATIDGNGRWQYSLDGGANWTDVGAVSNAAALLLRTTDSLRFVPNGQNATSASISYRAWDQTGAAVAGDRRDASVNDGTTAFSSAIDTATITVTAVNDAPVLAPAAPVLPAITEDDLANAGQTVASIVGTSISDADLGAVPGIAITATTDGNGKWQYSLDGGTNWLDIGAVSDASALLLDTDDRIRFVPDGQNATLASIRYRAWDQTGTGLAGDRADATAHGNATAFSVATDTATISVTAVNDAPVLTPVSPTLPPLSEDDTANAGQTVASFIGTSISDVDLGAARGIAITATTDGNGKWQYSLDGGGSWLDVGTVSDAAALLLDASDRVRFVPDGQNATTATIRYRAWDQTGVGLAGDRADTTVNGGTTAFSTATDTASITVTDLNNAPVLAPATPVLQSITEDDLGNAGQTVASFVGGSISDVDLGAVQGIAITSTTDGNGRWQYSIDGGTNWLDVGTVSEPAALLLRSTDHLRFVPDGLNATAASISYRAWDQTAGLAGARGNASVNGGATAFSTAIDTASLMVTAVNDAPVVSPVGPSLPTLTEDDTGNAGRTVASIVGTAISDVDLGAARGIAVTATADGNGRWQYSLDGGANWLDVGAVSDASSLLLRSTDHLRFVPDGQNATSASISYRAWDQTSGAVGDRFDTTVNGGTTAFSTLTDTADIIVTVANDAPVLTPVSPTLPSINEDDTANAGHSVASIVGTSINDVDLGAQLGIAITATDPGNGRWQYSIDNGGTWFNVGTVSDTSALLLGANDRLRFVPDGRNATSATISYRAWDRTGYEFEGERGDVTTAGGTTAYSTATDTVTITVTAINDAPVLTPAAPTLPAITEDDTANAGQTVASIVGTSISDVDSGAVQGIAVTATTDGNGRWQYSLDGGANWADVGAVADAAAPLLRATDSLRFVPDGQNATSATISYRAWDQTGIGVAGDRRDVSANDGTSAFSSATDTATITVTAVNDAPVLTPASPTLPAITEDNTGNSGQTVASIVGVSITDVDQGALQGIAITATADGNGRWQYSLDGGANWLDVGTVSDAAALLLRATDSVRFVPNGQNATAASIGYRAWDQTAGTAGNRADATVHGGTTAFSTATDTATITVTALNDAPVLTPAAPVLPSITEDDTSNAGQTVASIVGTSISDVDTGAVQGIAVTATTAGNGRWQYSLDGGANWTDVGAVSDAAALLLRSTDSLRFVPDGRNATTATISYRAWDQSGAGVAGDRGDASANDGTTAFSSATDTASITVTAVNDAPVLTPASPTLSAITEDETGNAGQTVASIIGASISDSDQAALEGIAITATTDGNGRWQYSLDGGANWLDVGAVSDAAALLLRATDSVRFVPNGQNATAASIGYRAWDQTTGTAGNRADATVHGGTTAFSTATDTATITVTALNDAPVLTPAAPVLPSITEDDTANAGQTVASIIGSSISDVDAGAVPGVAITATTDGNGRWQYSVDGGTSWLDVGSVSDTTALLLGTSDRIRFVPDGLNATSASVTFRAWDRTGAGLAGDRADASGNGGATAFSSATDTASITVDAVNDAPLLAPASPVLPSITEDDIANGGQTVASIVGTSISDVDSGAVQGIAITATTDGNGRWQYSLDGGTNWLDVGAVADSAALLLRATDSVRFVPDGQNATAASIGYRAWDQTAGAAGNRVDATGNGGTTAFSTATDTATITVTAVNDAPVLTPAAPVLPSITEDDVDHAGQAVAAIIGTSIADVDQGAVAGIAVTAITDGNGRWQYSLDSGATWLDVGAVSDNTALLLGTSDRLRFVPDGLNATSATISYRAWDRSAGTSGQYVDATGNGGTTPFSTATDTASIIVTAVNDAPVVVTTPGPTDYLENAAPVAVDDGLWVSDPDSTMLAGATVRITTGYVEGQDVLAFVDRGGITASWDAATGRLTLVGSASVADYQAALRSVTYLNTSEAPATAPRTISFTVNDGDLDSLAVTRVLTITAANDAPVLGGGDIALPAVDSRDANPAGERVGDLLAGRISDPDPGALQGIAVVAAATGSGRWQYSIDGGQSWHDIGPVSEDSALLLRADDRIRLVPQFATAGQASLSIRAWDQTAGSAGERADARVAGGTSAFSTASIAIGQSVRWTNSAPVLTSHDGRDQVALVMAPGVAEITAVTATDADAPAQQIVYQLAGGADAALFIVDPATGLLSWRQAPGAGALLDQGADGRYEVGVAASDGMTHVVQWFSIRLEPRDQPVDPPPGVLPPTPVSPPRPVDPVIVVPSQPELPTVAAPSPEAGPAPADRSESTTKGDRDGTSLPGTGAGDPILSELLGLGHAGVDLRADDVAPIGSRLWLQRSDITTEAIASWFAELRQWELRILDPAVSAAESAEHRLAGLEATEIPVDDSLPDDAMGSFDTTFGLGAGLSFGFALVLWVARSSALLTSLLVSTPAWRSYDLLPVLRGRRDSDEPDDRHLPTGAGDAEGDEVDDSGSATDRDPDADPASGIGGSPETDGDRDWLSD